MSEPIDATSRQSFEAWISAPPYDHEVLRYPEDDTRFAWPGQYRSIAVQRAWEAWQEARKIADSTRKPTAESTP